MIQDPKTFTIVICDTAIINQLAMVEYLKPSFDVLSVRHLSELKEVLLTENISLIIADFKEEDFSEWQNLAKLQGEKKQRWIAITSMPQNIDILRQAGFSTALTKPIDFDELDLAIKTHRT